MSVHTEVLALAGRPVPCMAASESFLSDDHIERAMATPACSNCPVLVTCGRYALDTKQVFGVWGGVDLTHTPGRPSAGHELLQARLTERNTP